MKLAFYKVELPDKAQEAILEYDGDEHQRTNETVDYLRAVVAIRDKKQAEQSRLERQKKIELAQAEAEMNRQSKFLRKEKSLVLVPTPKSSIFRSRFSDKSPDNQLDLAKSPTVDQTRGVSVPMKTTDFKGRVIQVDRAKRKRDLPKIVQESPMEIVYVASEEPINNELHGSIKHMEYEVKESVIKHSGKSVVEEFQREEA